MFRKISVVWERVRDAAVVVAVVSSVGAYATNSLSADEQRCRIATNFLIDDTKDDKIVDAETSKRLRALYVGMAEKNCGSTK